MSVSRLRLAALALCLPLACAHSAQSAREQSGGFAVAIGGAVQYDNDAIWSRLVQLAGGRGARYAVFATASGEPGDAAARAIEALQRHGAVAEHIAVAPALAGIDIAAAVRSEHWIARVRGARGIYFTGGAQDRIVDTLLPGGKQTPLLEAIWDVYRAGGVVAGSSAGAAIMSTIMFRDAPDVLSVMKVSDWNALPANVQIGPGLGFVGPQVFIDQHFLRRGRIGRALPLMAAKGYPLGIGVDEDSAAIIHGSDVEVIGAKGVLLMDLAGAHVQTSPVFNLRAARLTYLDRGDRIDLSTRQITPSALKRSGAALDPRSPSFKAEFADAPFIVDMHGDTAILRAMSHLIDSTASELRGLAFEAQPVSTEPRAALGFEYRLYKGEGSRGWYTGGFGGEDYTVANIYLDITPVRMAQPLYSMWPNGAQHKN